jgi:2-phospho-L-lactate guanylyltransferase
VTCWAIIPCKPSSESKRRLAGALDPRERQALVEAMLAHVVGEALAAKEISRTILLGPACDGVPPDLPRLDEPGGGLNAAVRSALEEVSGQGPDRVLFVHGDLPTVTARELDLLASLPAGAVGIAPDRHGTGTNALSLPLPAAEGFSFAFGPDSYAKHLAEAQRLGLAVETVRSAGLARDVDEPGDVSDAAELMKHAE